MKIKVGMKHMRWNGEVGITLLIISDLRIRALVGSDLDSATFRRIRKCVGLT